MIRASTRWLLPVLALILSCSGTSNDDDDDWGDESSTLTPGSPYGSSGDEYSAYLHFPLDGAERSWQYKKQDEDFLLSVEKPTDPTRDGSTYIHELRYAVKNPYRLLYSIKWSSDADDGVQIHGYQIADTDPDTGTAPSSDPEWVDFAQPIQVATAVMEVGEQIQSSAAGVTFRSSLDAFEGCPNDWRDDWECIRMTITADTDSAAPFLGTWHNATRFGTSLFQPPGSDHPWTLITADYVPN